MDTFRIKYQSHFTKAKAEGRKISVVTAYDYTSARLVADSEVDVILVGDSLGMVIQGGDSTLPVSLEEMLYHCRIVRRGAPDRFVVGDMPFGSYQGSADEALNNAGRFLKETGVQAVKLEGAGRFTALVERMTESSIPVMGHLGLTPQSIHNFGTYRVQGKDDKGRKQLVQAAKDLENAGAFAIVLELVVAETAEEISRNISIPTIGIGSGPGCDGQVLVYHDLLGMLRDFKPRFVKHFMPGHQSITGALNSYHSEVLDGHYPGPEHTFYNA